jgi:hypothetical protein
MSLGATSFSPLLDPRPDYPPFLPVLARAVLRVCRFGAFCAALSFCTRPIFTIVHDRCMREIPAEFIPQLYWVTPADYFFMIGLSSSITAIYIIGNGFFAALDEFKLLSQYKMPRAPWMEPKVELITATLHKQAVAHLVTGPAIMLLIAGPGLRGINTRDVVSPETFPSVLTMFWQFMVVLVVNDTMFYLVSCRPRSLTLLVLTHRSHYLCLLIAHIDPARSHYLCLLIAHILNQGTSAPAHKNVLQTLPQAAPFIRRHPIHRVRACTSRGASTDGVHPIPGRTLLNQGEAMLNQGEAMLNQR